MPPHVIGRTRGTAIPRDQSVDNVRVLRATVGYNSFVSPPPPAPPVVNPQVPEWDLATGKPKKVDPVRTNQPQGVTDAGQSFAPPAHAKPGAQPPVAGSGSTEWVVPTPMGAVPEVDKDGNRVESQDEAATKPKPEGEEEPDVTTGVFSVGSLPAGAILLRAVVEEVAKFEGDTASLEVGTRDEPGKFLSISGDEACPGGKDLGAPKDDFLLEPVDVVVTVTAGEDVKKFTNGSFSFAIFYLASNAKGKPAEEAYEAMQEAEAKAKDNAERAARGEETDEQIAAREAREEQEEGEKARAKEDARREEAR